MTDLSKKYQKMSDIEHILKKPDTYIGSIQPSVELQHTVVENAIQLMNFSCVPGLYKLFDEGLVNMRDHVIRQAQSINDGNKTMQPVTLIEVDVDSVTGTITMTNDGNGIDIAEHPDHKVWIPELIFAHMRTSTNYSEEKKVVGGKNGFGIKLVFVWSDWGLVETVDHNRGLKFVQEYRSNLSEICKPLVTNVQKNRILVFHFVQTTNVSTFQV